MNTPQRIATATLAAVLLTACASASSDKPIGYGWQGQPGAAARQFGGEDGAKAAFRRDEAACDYEVETATGTAPANPATYAGTFGIIFARSANVDRAESLFQRCMATRGWLPVTKAQ